jgi:tetratricopeptide (TPR) repeat protein
LVSGWSGAHRLLFAVDGSRFDEARQILTVTYGPDPSDPEGLLAWGYLSAQAKDLSAALRYYTEVLKERPENREALEGRTMTLEALGAAYRAAELAREPRGLLNQAERDRVAETEGALRLRWGRLPVADPAHRYDETDRAIPILERRVAELEARRDPASAAVLQRARFDLLVAYRDRSRMRDAVAVYERLRQDGVAVPAYSRLSAASAYLYLENPETARDLYQSVLDENPRDAEILFEVRLGLFYSWVELERYDRAYNRVAWQLFTQVGAEVYAWLPTEQAGRDPETTAAVYAALARSVPFRGVGMGPTFLAADLSPGPLSPGTSRWDPRTPRRVRAAQDRARLTERARLGLGRLDAVTRYQPAVQVLDMVDLQQLRPPAEVAVDAVDYIAVRWDGRPEEAIQKMKEQGWLEGDHWGRLVYWSSRGVPAEWRSVQRTGILNSVYCPDRLLDGTADLAAMSEVAGSATHPFRP